jgi:hypothetical protein
LAYKQITITSLSKKIRIFFPNLGSIGNEKISKAFIPYSWNLLKTIERLEAKGLLHVYFLLDWFVEEGALHVHLKQLKRMVSSIGQ